MQAKCKYTVKLAKTAADKAGYLFDSDYSYSFTTDRAKLILLSVYPKNNMTNISRTVQIRAKFDCAVNSGTLPNRVLLSCAKYPAMGMKYYPAGFAKGYILFSASAKLEANTTYKVTLLNGLGDDEGFSFKDSTSFSFTTEADVASTGVVLDKFDATGRWIVPDSAGISTGLDANNTAFTISNEQKNSNKYSGKLVYSFTGSKGICLLENPSFYSAGDKTAYFGAWVYGDCSNNLLNYYFTDGNKNFEKIPVDTINWTGWKLKTVHLSKLNLTGSLAFAGVAVERTDATSSATGQIYIDDVQNNIATGVEDALSIVPCEYKLDGNYPNPFNPSTTIRFTLAAESKVRVEIFDVLGNKVNEIQTGKLAQGKHEIKFDASRFASGVYLYRLNAAGNNGQIFKATGKMILLK
jgi:hypothetical protein